MYSTYPSIFSPKYTFVISLLGVIVFLSFTTSLESSLDESPIGSPSMYLDLTHYDDPQELDLQEHFMTVIPSENTAHQNLHEGEHIWENQYPGTITYNAHESSVIDHLDNHLEFPSFGLEVGDSFLGILDHLTSESPYHPDIVGFDDASGIQQAQMVNKGDTSHAQVSRTRAAREEFKDTESPSGETRDMKIPKSFATVSLNRLKMIGLNSVGKFKAMQIQLAQSSQQLKLELISNFRCLPVYRIEEVSMISDTVDRLYGDLAMSFFGILLTKDNIEKDISEIKLDIQKYILHTAYNFLQGYFDQLKFIPPKDLQLSISTLRFSQRSIWKTPQQLMCNMSKFKKSYHLSPPIILGLLSQWNLSNPPNDLRFDDLGSFPKFLEKIYLKYSNLKRIPVRNPLRKYRTRPVERNLIEQGEIMINSKEWLSNHIHESFQIYKDSALCQLNRILRSMPITNDGRHPYDFETKKQIEFVLIHRAFKRLEYSLIPAFLHVLEIMWNYLELGVIPETTIVNGIEFLLQTFSEWTKIHFKHLYKGQNDVMNHSQNKRRTPSSSECSCLFGYLMSMDQSHLVPIKILWSLVDSWLKKTMLTTPQDTSVFHTHSQKEVRKYLQAKINEKIK
ncbi:hypothetical protein DFH28DRAFT_295664 [Melampsora americana]|nr:hypothetical protein DFH28DRAFT_295664 [Melampsora americana]